MALHNPGYINCKISVGGLFLTRNGNSVVLAAANADQEPNQRWTITIACDCQAPNIPMSGSRPQSRNTSTRPSESESRPPGSTFPSREAPRPSDGAFRPSGSGAPSQRVRETNLQNVNQQAANLENVHGAADLEDVHRAADLEDVHRAADLEDVHGAADLEDVHGAAKLEDVHGAANLEDVHGAANLEDVPQPIWKTSSVQPWIMLNNPACSS